MAVLKIWDGSTWVPVGGGSSSPLYGPSGEIILTATPTGANAGPGVGRYTRPAGPQQDAHLRSGAAAGSFAFMEAQAVAFLAANEYWDGTNWQRFDTAAPHLTFQALASALSLTFRTGPAGANPIAGWNGQTTLAHDAAGRTKLTADTHDAIITSKKALQVGTNCTYDGTNWNRLDTALPALVWVFRETNQQIEIYRAPAGANPIVFGAAAVTLRTDLAASWNNFSYSAGWSDYGAGFPTGAWRAGIDGRVYLKGLVKKSSTPINLDVIATIPAGWRPSTDHIFAVPISATNVVLEVRVTAGGAVQLQGPANSGGPWTSLDGIAYDINT